MILLITLAAVLIAIAGLLGLRVLIRGKLIGRTDPEELRRRGRPVDVAAFERLISAEDDEFLRQTLPPSDYQVARKLRSLAVIEYVKAAYWNAGLVVKLAEVDEGSADETLRTAARDAVNEAVQLRFLCLLTLLRLRLELILPMSIAHLPRLVGEYAQLLGRVDNFFRLKRPSDASLFMKAIRSH